MGNRAGEAEDRRRSDPSLEAVSSEGTGALRLGRGSLAALLDGMPVGVVIGTRDRRAVLWNENMEMFLSAVDAEHITKLGHGQTIGCRPLWSCGPPSGCARCQLSKILLETFEAGGTVRSSVEVRVGAGGSRFKRRFRAQGSLVRSDGEEMAAVVVRDLDALLADVGPNVAYGISRLIGQSPVLEELKSTILDVAESRAPVLILGESGAGKELAARALHEHSNRHDELFVPVNCGALPEGLLETELFGHVRGSFTGAVRDRRGHFQMAHRGTIFLDEVAELSPALQVKLLRVLQDGTFTRVGEETPTTVDVRLLAATNQDLFRAMADGRFRPDLYYRLAVVPLEVPPLRDRREDIPMLARHLLERIAAGGGRIPPTIETCTLQSLSTYDWPGNVRELENALHYAFILSHGDPIEARHLPGHIRKSIERTYVAQPQGRVTPAQVRDALTRSAGNRTRAAELLGISRATLYRHLARLLDDEQDSH